MKASPVRRAAAAVAAATAIAGLVTAGQVVSAAAVTPRISAQGAPVALSPVPPATSPTGALVSVALGRTASRSVHDIEHQNGDTGPASDSPLAPRHGPAKPGDGTPTGVVQAAPAAGLAPSATSFGGTNNIDAVVPPDTDGAVGPNDYVELVNTHYEVFNKSGTPLAGPIETTQLFSRFANSTSGAQLCYYNAGGDGIVLYDRAADRWLVTQLGFTEGILGPQGPFVECMAVSQTSDPTGAYYAYAFLLDSSNLPDYPKFGIFGNSYYLSANLYSSIFASSGNPAVWAFDRNTMLAGGLPQSVEFAGDVPSTYNTILPANVNGATQPPPGEPEIYAGLDFANNTTLGIFQFSPVNWSNPGAATFTGPTNLTVAPYNTLCGLSQDCLPQPGTSQLLDAISDRVMQPLSYRNFGDHEALVMDHTVNVSTTGGNQAGVRWYEIDRNIVNGNATNQPFTIAQQGTYAPPDGNNRWMASTAMDGAGDMALGYSIASASMYPSVAFTGRSKCDPPNQMTVPEGMIQAGAGAQTGANRWGDYTDMSVDPTDDTTFWYVGEYYSATSASGWQTRIGSFTVPSCGGDTLPPTVTWTAPANNAYVHGTVSLSANATDDGSVATVAFYAGATLLATVTSAPYQTMWDTTSTADGTPVTLKAVATDGAGLQTTASETVTVDNSPPTVSLTSPAPGAALSGTVALAATAADAGSPVAQVAFLVDGTPVGTSAISPYTTSWSTGTVANGPHTLTAQATDEAGNTTISAPVNVTVSNGSDTTPPTVTWTAPANNAVVGGTVTLTANASDDTSVTSVVFAANGTKVATATSSPYQASWNTTSGYADGTKVTLTATATDSAGFQSTATESVTVDNSPPTVNVTAPTAGAVLSGSVPLTATAADAGSSVTKVEFLVDGSVVGMSTTSPFGVMWNSATVANGSHTVAARATDGAGNVTTSAGVVVSVNNAGTVMQISSMAEYGSLGVSTWKAWATVTVVDQHGKPVSGVTVTFSFTGGATATKTCKTGSNGSCSTSGSKVTVPLTNPTENVVTTNVTKSGATWNGVKYGASLTG
jgi:hypothetical protein